LRKRKGEKEKKMKHILIMTAFWGCLSVLWAQAPEALIREIAGTVELKPAGQTEWVPAKAGDMIAASTVLSTGFKSTALIAVGNSTLAVRPLTRLSLEELVSRDGTETVQVSLRTGRLRAVVAPPTGEKINFTVRTPTATASVRGTVFDIDALNLRVREGAVRYEAAAAPAVRPVRVSAGQNTWVDSDSGGTLNPLTAAEVDRSLPALPGGASVPAPEGGARPALSQGALALAVTLEPQPQQPQ
jgi:hypothetical protein